MKLKMKIMFNQITFSIKKEINLIFFEVFLEILLIIQVNLFNYKSYKWYSANIDKIIKKIKRN